MARNVGLFFLLLFPVISFGQPDSAPLGQTKTYIINKFKDCYLHIYEKDIVFLECDGMLYLFEFDENEVCNVYGINLTANLVADLKVQVINDGTYLYMGKKEESCPPMPKVGDKEYACDAEVYWSNERGLAVYFYPISLDGYGTDLQAVVTLKL